VGRVPGPVFLGIGMRADLHFDVWVDYGGSKFSLPKMATNIGHQILIFRILRGQLGFFEIPPNQKISILRPS
jgi:hypothetical protein